MWASCPHACITPFVWLRNGSSPVSSIGSASMSERSATTPPGRPPRSTPTAPVFATG